MNILKENKCIILNSVKTNKKTLEILFVLEPLVDNLKELKLNNEALEAIVDNETLNEAVLNEAVTDIMSNIIENSKNISRYCCDFLEFAKNGSTLANTFGAVNINL